MTLTPPNIVVLGTNIPAIDSQGSNIFSVIGYETTLDFPTRQLVIQYMLSTAKGMHSFISPLQFTACTTLTPNT